MRLVSDLASENYDVTIKLRPNDAAAYYNRGLAKQRKGNIGAGDADVAAARRLAPSIGK